MSNHHTPAPGAVTGSDTTARLTYGQRIRLARQGGRRLFSELAAVSTFDPRKRR